MKEKVYEELCNNYRFFLRWRHATFAGNLIVVGGALTVCASALKNAPEIAPIIPLLASPIGLAFWALDLRTRSIFRLSYDAGIELEGEHKGFFSQLKNIGATLEAQEKSPYFTHSKVLDIVYLGSSLAMAGLSFWLFCK